MDRIKIDRSSDVSIFIQERDAIQWLDAIMRNQGASHDEFLAEVAKRYKGPEAKKLLAEHNREKEQKRQQHLDRISYAEHKEQHEREEQLANERQAAAKSLQTGNGIEPERDALDPADHDLIEPNIDLTADPEHDTARPPSDRSAEIHEPATETGHDRDPYIEQAIQEARERQESWERGIDPDRDNDRGFGIE
jgi:hypothetical protein